MSKNWWKQYDRASRKVVLLEEKLAKEKERADKAEALLRSIQIPSDPGLPTESTLALIEDLLDTEACWFDHHGGCQVHGYLSLQPGEKCPQQQAKDLLAEHKFQRQDIEDAVKYGETGGEDEPE